jgi:hypothetical protein
MTALWGGLFITRLAIFGSFDNFFKINNETFIIITVLRSAGNVTIVKNVYGLTNETACAFNFI